MALCYTTHPPLLRYPEAKEKVRGKATVSKTCIKFIDLLLISKVIDIDTLFSGKRTFITRHDVIVLLG